MINYPTASNPLTSSDHRVMISVGANQGDPFAQITSALNLIAGHDSFRDTSMSPLYKTSPVDYENQPDFINAIILTRTALSPLRVLSLLKDFENQIGANKQFHKGPRFIDLDLIFHGSHILNEGPLVLPHPSAHKRLFVLAPLCDVCPDYIHPVLKMSCHDLFVQCKINHHDQKIEKLCEIPR